jgi:hypothetical protein
MKNEYWGKLPVKLTKIYKLSSQEIHFPQSAGNKFPNY